MNKQEATQCALGYAWGVEDTSGIRTAQPANITGCSAFADAFAQGWDEYNTDRRGMMTNVRSAYERWQASNGQTIWDEHTRPAEATAGVGGNPADRA